MKKLVIAAALSVVAAPITAAEVDESWRPFFDRVSIMYAQNYCGDYLITNSGEERMKRLDALDASIKFADVNERMDIVIDTVDKKASEVGVKTFCGMIASALPKIYQVRP